MLSNRKLQYLLDKFTRDKLLTGVEPTDKEILHYFNMCFLQDKITNPSFKYEEFSVNTQKNWRDKEVTSIDKHNKMIDALSEDFQLCMDELIEIYNGISYFLDELTIDLEKDDIPVFTSSINGRYPLHLPFYNIKFGEVSTIRPELFDFGFSSRKGVLPGSNWESVVNEEKEAFFAYYGICGNSDSIGINFKFDVYPPEEGVRSFQVDIVASCNCEISLNYKNSQDAIETITQSAHKSMIFVLPESIKDTTFNLQFKATGQVGKSFLFGITRIKALNGENSLRGSFQSSTIEINKNGYNKIRIEVDPPDQPAGTYALFYLAQDKKSEYVAVSESGEMVMPDNILGTNLETPKTISTLPEYYDDYYLTEQQVIDFVSTHGLIGITENQPIYTLMTPYNSDVPSVDEFQNIGQYELIYNSTYLKNDLYDDKGPEKYVGIQNCFKIGNIKDQIPETLNLYFGKNCWELLKLSYIEIESESVEKITNSSGYIEIDTESVIPIKYPVNSVKILAGETVGDTNLEKGVDWRLGISPSPNSTKISIILPEQIEQRLLISYNKAVQKYLGYVKSFLKVYGTTYITLNYNPTGEFSEYKKNQVRNVDIARIDPVTGRILTYNKYHRDSNNLIKITLPPGLFAIFIPVPYYSASNYEFPDARFHYEDVIGLNNLSIIGSYIRYSKYRGLSYTPYENFSNFISGYSAEHFTVDSDGEVIINNLFLQREDVSNKVGLRTTIIGTDLQEKADSDFGDITISDYFYMESSNSDKKLTNALLRVEMVSLNPKQTPIINNIKIIDSTLI